MVLRCFQHRGQSEVCSGPLFACLCREGRRGPRGEGGRRAVPDNGPYPVLHDFIATLSEPLWNASTGWYVHGCQIVVLWTFHLSFLPQINCRILTNNDNLFTSRLELLKIEVSLFSLNSRRWEITKICIKISTTIWQCRGKGVLIKAPRNHFNG